MALIKRIDITNGQWMTWVEITPTHAEILWFDHEPTEAEAEAFVANWLAEHEYDDTPHQPMSIYDAKEAIEAAVVYIKTTANLTLTKWNTYIATLPLNDQYAVKWFIVTMAMKLAEMNEVTLGTFTELQILSKMKAWFIATPARKIKKIFYGVDYATPN